MKTKKILALMLALSIMLVGCTEEGKSNENVEESKSGINSEYINLTMIKPETINPLLNKDKSVGYIMNLIYDGLFTIDQNYNIVPQLAKEYSVSSDGKTINIKLKDAKWHNGNSVTADDVKFSVELIQKNQSSPYNTLVSNISSVSVINNKELNINFKEQYAFSKDTLIFPIVSRNELAGLSASQILENDKNLIGNGPYKIKKMEIRGGMTLVVNENYYEELPKAMRDIKVSIVPNEEDQVSMVLALESDITRISLKDLSKFYNKEFNTTTYEGRSYESIIFNYDNELFRDENFRKAIAHSINKKTILEEGYISNASLVNFPLNTKSKYYDSEVKPLEYDKKKALEYLNKINPGSEKMIEDNSNLSIDSENSKIEADTNSEEDVNSDIKNDNNDSENKELSKEDRKKLIKELNLKIIVNKNNEERLKAANIVSKNLDSIGIKSTIEGLSEEEMSKALNDKKYDLAFVGWELSSVPDVRSIINSTGYKDEKLNGYMTSLESATSDKQIGEIYSAMQKYVTEKAAFVSLVIRNEYVVTNRRLEGTSVPNDFDVYEGISNLTIKK